MRTRILRLARTLRQACGSGLGPPFTVMGSLVVLGILAGPLGLLTAFTGHLPAFAGTLLQATGLEHTTLVGIWAGALAPATAFALHRAHRWTRRNHSADPDRARRLSVLATLILTFVGGFSIARFVVVAGSWNLPWADDTLDVVTGIGEVWINGYHLHHFFLGIALVALAGVLALLAPQADARWLASIQGLGLGIFVDEVGLLLTWGDYHALPSWTVAVGVLTLLTATTLWTLFQAQARPQDLLAEETRTQPRRTEA